MALGWQKWWKVFENRAQIVSNKLIELADVKLNSKVLYIATGIGEPAISAAKYVGNSEYVLATDLSPHMLAIAKERAKSRNFDNMMDFREGDGETIALQLSTFDVAFCRWGLMFLPNITAGLDSQICIDP